MLAVAGMSALAATARGQPAPRVTPQQILPDVRLQQLPLPEAPAPVPEIPIPEMPPTRAPAGAESVRFVFGGLDIEGASVYPPAVLEAEFRAAVGEEVTLAAVFAMAERIQRRYREDGYFLTRVIVPAQTIRDGRMRLRVLEGYIARIDVVDEVGPATRLVRAYLERVGEERPIRLSTLERALLLANDIPGLAVAAVLQPSATEFAAADLTVSITRTPVNGFVTIDNYGDEFTGEWQGAAGVSANTFTALGEQIGLIGFLSDPSRRNNEVVGQLNGSWRLGAGGLFFEHVISYGNAEPGASIENFEFESRELLVGTTAGYPLLRRRNESLWLRAGFDYVDSDTDVFGGEKFSRDRLRIAHVGIKTELRDRWRGLSVGEVSVRQGLPVLGATRRGDADASRQEGTAISTVVDASLMRRQPVVGNLAVFALVGGQYAFSNLLAEQEFEVGGTRFGRGYDFAELSGDDGIGLTLELQYSWRPQRYHIDVVQPFLFYDRGQVWERDNEANGFEQRGGSLSSAGIGVRASAFDVLTLELTVAKPLTRDSQRANDGRAPQVLFRAIGRF